MKVALLTSRLSLRGGGIAAAVIALADALAATSAVRPSLIGFDAPPDENPNGGDGRCGDLGGPGRNRAGHSHDDHGACNIGMGDVGSGGIGGAGHSAGSRVNGGFSEANDHGGVGVTVLPAVGPAAFRIALALGRTLGAGGFDVVHTHGLWTWASVAAAAWARRSGRALVVSPHGMLDGWALACSAAKKRAALALFERAHLSRATVMHALTAAEAAAIRDAGCTAPIAVIPNGIDMPSAASERCDHAATRARDPRNVLLFLGRLHPKKGVEELIAGWAKAVTLDPALAASWRLQISGWDDGGHLGRLLAAAARSGAAESISFTGPLVGAATADAYARASAFILPSASEGLPMTILEAWSHGLPVFATTACNIPDGFAYGAAIAIDRDPEAIATTLVAALHDRPRLAATGAAGRRLAAEQYAWGPIAARWRAVYAWAEGHAPMPPDIVPARVPAPAAAVRAIGHGPPPVEVAATPDGLPAPSCAVATPGRTA